MIMFIIIRMNIKIMNSKGKYYDNVYKIDYLPY